MLLLEERVENESFLSQGRAQGVSVLLLSDEMTFGKKIGEDTSSG